MSHFQTCGHLNRDAGGLLNRKAPFSLDIIFQGDPFHQFHDNIVNPTLVPYVVDIDNVWMGKSCRRLRFFFEFFDETSVLPEFFL